MDFVSLIVWFLDVYSGLTFWGSKETKS